ncbi:uncharacterized protein SEPMUDRAFT_135360 [Sphaerulina musiva SO2202]|uniref:Apple domain-containing protein n=1 Tax=Sphaerulina musiva (strain SO2202) TaxID=692275 RepID=M3AV53_SPHMS|nr:uncharacterized protein SEPMUDRAFT_135360 [Sphaerulina musiva SO2202]EMF09956.1 hypothetical protein SEPMUDRAFT_135360 [Sphaerulina musiva SO2202]
MAPSTFASLSGALFGMIQLSNSLIITQTVHRSFCPATTTASLPSCGWISASGSTSIPYCFSTSSSQISIASSTRTAPVISITVTPLPSTLNTNILTTTIVSSVTATATATTLSTVYFPPGYNSASSSSSTASTTTTVTSIGDGSAPVYGGASTTTTSITSTATPPGYQGASSSSITTSTLTTSTTNIGAPGYGDLVTTTTTTTTSTSTSPTNALITPSIVPTSLPTYCYQDGALLNAGVNITITDNAGQAYVLLCLNSGLDLLGVGLSGIALATVSAPNSADDCLAVCDAEDECTGFAFQSIAGWGIGPGTCFLYSGIGLSFTNSELLNLIAFIKLDALTGLPLRRRGRRESARRGVMMVDGGW